MKKYDRMDFNRMADVLVLYYEQKNSLFAGQVLSEKLGESPEMIRSEILAWAGAAPEQLIRHLEPAVIKQVISETARDIKYGRTTCPEIDITAMATDETEQGGRNLFIHYGFADTPFGPVIIASTTKGVCCLAFSDEGNEKAFDQLKKRFPSATYKKAKDKFQSNALSLFENRKGIGQPVQLHLKGTDFQIKTWEKLLKIPFGGLMSYSSLTDDLRNSHALGAAVGSNPVAYIIPCHRTVRASGVFGEYHWGTSRKAALICLEALQSGR